MHLVKVDHHNGVMSLETTFRISEGYRFLEVYGQGRVVGLLIQRPLEPPCTIVIHLDHPGAYMEFNVSPTYATEARLTLGNFPYFRVLGIPQYDMVF